MELSLKNFKIQLSKELIKKAEQNPVRECDEIEAGHFQAYVDELNQTFDVGIQVNKAGVVTQTSCDCRENTTFCRHKAALLLNVTKDKRSTTQVKIKKAKKTDPIEALLEAADPAKLKSWLKEVLSSNKDLALVFTHQFSETQINYTPATVKSMTLDAVKAVLKNKRKPDISEVKKIIDLWSEIHKPILEQYYLQVENESAFLNYNAIFEACQATEDRLNTNSTRMITYQANILQPAMDAIYVLKDEEAWDLAIRHYMAFIGLDPYRLRMLYLSMLTKLHTSSNIERKQRLAHKLAQLYSTFDSRRSYLGENFTRALLQMIVDSNLFDTYKHLFKPIHFDNGYNSLLISMLIDNGDLALAEQYCLDQIKANQQEEFNLYYLQFLEEIYEEQKDHRKLDWVLMQLFPYSFNFDTFIRLLGTIEGAEEQKKWRTKMLTKARQLANHHPGAQLFSFQLMHHEENYKKLTEYINEQTPYHLILYYADVLALTNREAFLLKLTEIGNYYSGTGTPEDEEETNLIFAKLLDILLKQYLPVELSAAVHHSRRSYYYAPNRFVTYLKSHLAGAQ